MSTIPYRIGTTILDEIERVYDYIRNRACQFVLRGTGTDTLDLDDWFTAEKQLLWKPDAELIEKRGLFIVSVALNVVNPAAIDILVTEDDVLVQSNSSRHPRLFRAVHFPLPVNPLELHATCVKGKLILIAPKLTVRSAFERASA